MNAEVESVLSFWLEPKPQTESETDARYRYWFYGGEPVDREIRARFAALVEQARSGALDAWAESPRGRLALIILIDQFSRNLHRGTPAAFSLDPKTLALAADGFDRGMFDDGFDELDRLFAHMPFRHAEDLAAQSRCVLLAQRDMMTCRAPWRTTLLESVEFARKHLDVIARFGRFPHRNATLGRESTADELEYTAYLKHVGQWL